jgi:hypothetical protein
MPSARTYSQSPNDETEVADMCPVHRTLDSEVVVENSLVG